MQQDSPQIIDDLLKLYFQLLDLSRDVERNSEDAEYENDDGKIHYVFDATTLEVFINPQDHRGKSTSLHADIWFSDFKNEKQSRQIASQTALATMEYLFSGNLPCQERSIIYMTEWHRWEFKRRIDLLQVEQVAALRAATPEAVIQRFSRVRAVLDTFDRGPSISPTLINDPDLVSDLSAYKTRSPNSEALRNFLLTRLAVATLACDELVEPSEQLRRLVTAPIRHNVQTLHLAMRPSPSDFEAIRQDAQRWMRRLRDECARNNIVIVKPNDDEHGLGAGPRRSEGAVWDDARSIALVRWASAHKTITPTKERVLFVTADHIVFDAYRRWYADMRMDDKAYGEIFFMRRLGQYTPVFNLVASGRLEGEKYRELFQDLLHSLETILLPLNLSRVASKAPDVVVTRMRERTALRPIEPGSILADPAYRPLVHALSQGDTQQHLVQVMALIDRWRELERAALGGNDERVQRRIQNALTAEEMYTGLDPDVSQRAYEQYISELVRILLSGSQDVSLPLAREFIEHWPNKRHDIHPRAPIVLNLTIDAGSSILDVGKLLEDRLKGPERKPLLDEAGWKSLFERPHLVFAIAAAHCMSLDDWSNGQKFAALALEVTDNTVHRTDVVSDQDAEIRYLNALAARFRIGEIGPPLTGDAFARIDKLYRKALRYLNRAEVHHSYAEAGTQTLRLLRTRSERAALRLFVASSLNPWVRLAAAKRQPAQSRQAERRLSEARRPEDAGLPELNAKDLAIKSIEDAETDLMTCLKMDSELEDVSDHRRSSFRRKVRRQFITNIGCVSVIRTLWDLNPESSPSQLSPYNFQMAKILKLLGSDREDSAHTIINVSVYSFLSLGGSTSAFEKLSKLPSIEPSAGNLSLDVAVVEAVLSKLALFQPSHAG
jgi:hypothetical protein